MFFEKARNGDGSVVADLVVRQVERRQSGVEATAKYLSWMSSGRKILRNKMNELKMNLQSLPQIIDRAIVT